MSQIKFLHGNDISTAEVPFDAGTFYLDLKKNELWYDDPSNTNTSNHIRLFDGLFSDIYKQLGDLNYKKIEIASFQCTNVPTTLQSGATVKGNLVFNWSTSKTPKILKVNNTQTSESILAPSGSITLTNQTFSSNKTYTLTAEDERTLDNITYPDLAAATKSTTFTFCQPVIYGSITKNIAITSDVLNGTLNLSNKLANSTPAGTYAINCGTVSDNRISVFAYPKSWGDVKMVVGGLEVEWEKIEISYTPKNFMSANNLVTYTGSPIAYNVYYGTNVGLGNLSVVVSKK